MARVLVVLELRLRTEREDERTVDRLVVTGEAKVGTSIPNSQPAATHRMVTFLSNSGSLIMLLALRLFTILALTARS